VKRALLFIALALAVRGADTLDAVLNRMDQASKTFKSLTADVHHTEYSNLFQETKVEDGTFKMMKKAKSGVMLLAEFSGQDERKIHVASSELQIYHPKAKSVDIYETKKFTKSADLLILVGFGTSRAELQKQYSISLGPSESLGTVRTTRIDLKPKSDEEKYFFNEIQLWIPEDKGNPIQEKILMGKENKDYNLLQFAHLTINPSVGEAAFEMKLPPDVKKIKAGK
jgi:outer membrane lipoprotein-sorting protein